MTTTDPQVGFRFRLLHPDGRAEVMVVDSDRALVGSAAHCEVRLPPEVAASEHLEVYVANGVVHWAARRVTLETGLPTMDGESMTEGTWGKESVLAIGSMQLRVETIALGLAKPKPPYWLFLVAIPLLGVTMATLAMARGPGTSELAIPDPPALLPPPDAATCRAVPADQRAGLAHEALRVALSKRERSPFAPGDGVEAVMQLEHAAACFTNAGMAGDAGQATEDARKLRERLEDDYRVHRVRVEHAYRTHDPAVARRELEVLIPLTAHLRGPYIDWLNALDRAAAAELANRGKFTP